MDEEQKQEQVKGVLRLIEWTTTGKRTWLKIVIGAILFVIGSLWVGYKLLEAMSHGF